MVPKLVHKTSGIEIPSGVIQQFEMIESFNSMLITAVAVVGDVNNEILSAISIGEEFTVSIQEEKKTVRASLSILKFSKGASESAEGITPLVLNFVSSWYFSSLRLKAAYTATPSEILSDIFLKGVAVRPFNFYSDTSDTRAFTHYRMGDNALSFIKRVEEYGLKDDTPMFLYTELGDNIKYRGISTFFKAPVRYTLASRDVATGSKILNPISFRVSSDAGKANSLSEVHFNYENFLNPEILGEISIGNAEIDASLSSVKTPDLRINLDWSVTPTIAHALAVRTVFKRNLDVLFASCVFSDCVLSLKIGDRVYLRVPCKDKGTTSDPADAKGTGYYIVVGKTYSYTQASGTLISVVTLMDANIPENEETE